MAEAETEYRLVLVIGARARKDPRETAPTPREGLAIPASRPKPHASGKELPGVLEARRRRDAREEHADVSRPVLHGAVPHGASAKGRKRWFDNGWKRSPAARAERMMREGPA